jgi:hypothetical protein
MDEAPGVPDWLVSTLTAVARFADEDGRGAYPSAAAVAKITRKSRTQAGRNMAALAARGLLLPGDPGLVKDIRADRRPNVYDLPMPRGASGRTPQQSSRGASGRTPSRGPRGAPGDATGCMGLPNDVHLDAHEEVLNRPEQSSARGRGPADIIRAAYPDATDDEIETITRDKISRGARSPEAVLVHEIREGALRLPCNPSAPGHYSGACRDGNPAGCAYGWCACRCHTRPRGAGP